MPMSMFCQFADGGGYPYDSCGSDGSAKVEDGAGSGNDGDGGSSSAISSPGSDSEDDQESEQGKATSSDSDASAAEAGADMGARTGRRAESGPSCGVSLLPPGSLSAEGADGAQRTALGHAAKKRKRVRSVGGSDSEDGRSTSGRTRPARAGGLNNGFAPPRSSWTTPPSVQGRISEGGIRLAARDLEACAAFAREMAFPEDSGLEVPGPCEVSLVDRISLARLKVPCRGHACKHLEAFELSTYEAVNKVELSDPLVVETPRCPICNEETPVASLIVDMLMFSLLDSVKGRAVQFVLHPEKDKMMQASSILCYIDPEAAKEKARVQVLDSDSDGDCVIIEETKPKDAAAARGTDQPVGTPVGQLPLPVSEFAMPFLKATAAACRAPVPGSGCAHSSGGAAGAGTATSDSGLASKADQVCLDDMLKRALNTWSLFQLQARAGISQATAKALVKARPYLGSSGAAGQRRLQREEELLKAELRKVPGLGDNALKRVLFAMKQEAKQQMMFRRARQAQQLARHAQDELRRALHNDYVQLNHPHGRYSMAHHPPYQSPPAVTGFNGFGNPYHNPWQMSLTLGGGGNASSATFESHLEGAPCTPQPGSLDDWNGAMGKKRELLLAAEERELLLACQRLPGQRLPGMQPWAAAAPAVVGPRDAGDAAMGGVYEGGRSALPFAGPCSQSFGFGMPWFSGDGLSVADYINPMNALPAAIGGGSMGMEDRQAASASASAQVAAAIPVDVPWPSRKERPEEQVQASAPTKDARASSRWCAAAHSARPVRSSRWAPGPGQESAGEGAAAAGGVPDGGEAWASDIAGPHLSAPHSRPAWGGGAARAPRLGGPRTPSPVAWRSDSQADRFVYNPARPWGGGGEDANYRQRLETQRRRMRLSQHACTASFQTWLLSHGGEAFEKVRPRWSLDGCACPVVTSVCVCVHGWVLSESVCTRVRRALCCLSSSRTR